MQQSHSSEAKSHTTSQEPAISRYPEIREFNPQLPTLFP